MSKISTAGMTTGIATSCLRYAHGMAVRLILIASAVFISACAMQNTKAPVSSVPTSVTPLDSPQRTSAEEEVSTMIVDRRFAADSLYALLVAEVAGSRNRLDVMLNNYVQQAKKTQDPGVTARASRIARYLNAHAESLDMALLWTELAPENSEAHFNATAALVYENRLLEAFDHAHFLLKAGETSGLDAIGAKAATGDIQVTKELIKHFEPLLKTHPKNLSVQLGYSFLAHHAGDLKSALVASRKVSRIKTNHIQGTLQSVRVLQQMGEAKESLALMSKLVDAYPDNKRLRLQYARSLTMNDLEGAQKQFVILLEQSPNDPDLTLALGLVYFERGLHKESKRTLSELTDNPRYDSTAHFYLARIARGQQDLTGAVFHFGSVGYGNDFLSAQAQLSQLFIDSNQLDRALEEVSSQRQNAPEIYREGLQMIEANIFISSRDYPKAENILNKALESFPDSTQALYSRAILYTNMNNFEDAEVDLKRIIELKPSHAAALNALGYSLAEKTDRLDEALDYVNRAIKITPNDPAVIDSMGWILYRLGKNESALGYLRRAFAITPDHEIAAHLGEVLWVMGIKNEARQVWQQGLKTHPESSIIEKTMQRLNAKIMQ